MVRNFLSACYVILFLFVIDINGNTIIGVCGEGVLVLISMYSVVSLTLVRE